MNTDDVIEIIDKIKAAKERIAKLEAYYDRPLEGGVILEFYHRNRMVSIDLFNLPAMNNLIDTEIETVKKSIEAELKTLDQINALLDKNSSC